MELKPVGQRPRCLYCQRELKPNFKWQPMPYRLSDEEKKQWKKEHPREFLGNYGSYKDSLFCGLNCGFDWAVRNARR